MQTPSIAEVRDHAFGHIDRRGGAAMRRGGRGRGSVNKAPSLLPKVLPIFAGGSVFLADKHLVDGVSGKLYAFQDQIDPTHYLMQATSAKQVALPTADATMRGAKTATFAGAQCYVSTRAASAWKHFHDGSGNTWILVLAKTQTALSARLWATVNAAPGSDCLQDSPAAGSVRTRYWAGGFGNVGQPTSDSSLTAGTPTYYLGSYKENITPEITLYARGTLAASMQSLLAPSTANPGATFTLAANGNGTSDFASFRFRAFLSAAPGKVLSAGEIATVQQWIQQDTGIAP